MVEVSYAILLNTMVALEKVEKLLNKKRAIEAELRSIRRECTHTDQQIGMVPQGPGCQMEIRWMCVNCAETLGYPTEREVDHYVRKK